MIYKLPKEIIFAYDDLFLGNGVNFPLSMFTRYSPSNCSKLCLELFRYGFETRLNWNHDQVRDFMSMDILKILHLNSLLQFIPFPGSLNPEESLFYIAWLIYPETKNKSIIDVELNLYQKFLDHKIPKLPKGYFTDDDGITRAYNCLIYGINKMHPFVPGDPFVEYEFFASMNCVSFLRKLHLVKIYNGLDFTPLEFFHYALPPEQRNELLFNYFQYLCQNEYIQKLKTKESV